MRERHAISLSDAIAKVTYWPAKLLEDTVPQMKKKGRLQPGMDADIVVFDPATVHDRATYDRPNQTSVGMTHVLVNGVPVITGGELMGDARPGKPVRRNVTAAADSRRPRSDRGGFTMKTAIRPDEPAIWLRNVRVFDGVSDRLTEPCHVLVRGSTIAQVGDDVGEAQADAPSAGGSGATAQEFDGSGHVLMPGLIDAHYHVAFSTVSLPELLAADPGYLGIRSAAAARETLLRGFTTVRDVGGPVFGLKRAIDEVGSGGPGSIRHHDEFWSRRQFETGDDAA